jgi:serine/threonine-protein kinase
VAVKVISTGGIGGSLRDEAALLGTIKSKHVVELFELGVDPTNGKDYMIMESVAGSDLTGYTSQDGNSLYKTLYQIASGLADIHKANCIHRDLKPDNLKRDGTGIIKIIDFGIGANQSLINTNSGRGTNGYRGAEYYLGSIQLTTATDIYAFGVIAFEFCFGNLDPSLFQEPPDRPPSFSTASIGATNEKIAPEIIAHLDRCFNTDPATRPSAIELKLLLAKHLLRNQHVATFVHGGTPYSVSYSSNQYQITASKGKFEVRYNGLDFILSNVERDIFVNGISANPGMVLPGSCVITIGSGSGIDRVFIPFDVSHPEVVL